MPSPYDFSRLSVLVVEDSRFMRSLLVTTLRALGVERVLTAENGEEAIAIMSPAMAAASMGETMVGRTGVDLVLSDFVMPVVDGAMLVPALPDDFGGGRPRRDLRLPRRRRR